MNDLTRGSAEFFFWVSAFYAALFSGCAAFALMHDRPLLFLFFVNVMAVYAANGYWLSNLQFPEESPCP